MSEPTTRLYRAIAEVKRDGVALPWLCLSCGYAEVPDEDFEAHDCDDFIALTEPERAANERASLDDAHRRVRAANERII